MADSLLTERDTAAIIRLLESAVEGEENPRVGKLWQDVLRRFKGDVRARPASIAPTIIALLNAARAADLTEVDRQAKLLSEGLHRHGDLEGSAILKRVAEAAYERPAPSQKPTPKGTAGPSTGSAPTTPGAMRPPAKKEGGDVEEFIKWYSPEDLSEVMVLDETTGPALRRLLAELQAREALIKAGIDPPTRIQFAGPPGTGKTLGARWLGGALGVPVAAAKLGKMMSKWLGESTNNLMRVLERAAEQGAIVFLDEIESISGNRADSGGGGAHDEYKRLTGALLQALDQFPPEQIVIAATNFRHRIDDALAERLSFEVAFVLPDEIARLAQVKRLWKTIASDPAAVSYLVAASDGRSGRFIRAAAMSAARAAIVSASTGQPIGSVNVDDARILIEHVEPAILQARRAEEEAQRIADGKRAVAPKRPEGPIH